MKSALLFWENIKVFVGIRGLWKCIHAHRTENLLQFEATEDDSAWQLIWASQYLKNPEQRAELFSQILEETHHAELFRSYLVQKTNTSLTMSKMCFFKKDQLLRKVQNRILQFRKPLYTNVNEIWKYFPYCIVGETAASERFALIVKYLNKNDLELKGLFQKILSDEVGHIHKAKQLARELNRPEKEIQRVVSQIQLQRFKENWIRSGKKIFTFPALAVITLIYLLALPPFAFISQIKRKNNL